MFGDQRGSRSPRCARPKLAHQHQYLVADLRGEASNRLTVVQRPGTAPRAPRQPADRGELRADARSLVRWAAQHSSSGPVQRRPVVTSRSSMNSLTNGWSSPGCNVQWIWRTWPATRSCAGRSRCPSAEHGPVRSPRGPSAAGAPTRPAPTPSGVRKRARSRSSRAARTRRAARRRALTSKMAPTTSSSRRRPTPRTEPAVAEHVGAVERRQVDVLDRVRQRRGFRMAISVDAAAG